MNKCLICGEEFNQGHNWKHFMSKQEYYDKYIKKGQEGLCKKCGKPTIWHRQKFCYDEYCANCKPKKRHSTYNNRKQAIETCKERFDGKMNKGAWETRKKHLDEFEKEHNCIRTKKLIEQYGQGWLKLNLPRIYMNKQNTFISNEYLPQIIEYSKTNRRRYHKTEKQLAEKINAPTKLNVKIFNKEFDIFIPDYNIMIEFNGTHWHSIEYGTDKYEHRKRSIICKENNIRLVHIFEFEDLDEQINKINQLLLGNDTFEQVFTKNNLLDIPKEEPKIIYQDKRHTIYSA